MVELASPDAQCAILRQLLPLMLLFAACATPQTGSSTKASDCRNSPIMTSVQGSRDQIMLFRRDCPGEGPTINISVLSLDSVPSGVGNVLVVEDTSVIEHRRGLAVGSFRGPSRIEVIMPLYARVVSWDSLVAGYHIRFSVARDPYDSARTVFTDSELFKQKCTQADSGRSMSSVGQCTLRDQRLESIER